MGAIAGSVGHGANGGGAKPGAAAFGEFEQRVSDRLAALVGHPVGHTSVKGRPRKLPANKAVLRTQPWFGPTCRAAKARWKQRVHLREPQERIAEARREYRSTCRRARIKFCWEVDRYRVHN